MSQVPSPDRVPDTGDPGADTMSRFAYQHTYAAILVCSLLDAGADVVDVFCEHHEDVLLRHSDHTFTGVQIKTRELGSNPWKATDDAILNALARFARLEQTFPGHFRAFVIATNHSFLSGKKTKTNLPFVLGQASEASDETTCPATLKSLLKKLAADVPCAESVALATLKKCRCDESLPKLTGILRTLINTLGEFWGATNDCVYEQLSNAAEALKNECYKASSLDHAQALPAFISAIDHDGAVAVQAELDGKRFERTRLDRVLRAAIAAQALLKGATFTDLLSNVGLLELKLAAGGFSVVSVNSAKDLQDKADFQALEWMSRFGRSKGRTRRDHIRSIVLSDCASAYEATRREDAPFGVAMREEFKRRLRARREGGGATLFDCLDEHLEGYAYVMTGECQVLWSAFNPARKAE